ncbi:MAG: Hpt domain-containing protein [Synergistaceae bacterium]
METESLYEKLIAWGADVKKARERLLEDDELYVNCLKDFAADRNFELLRVAVSEERWRDAFEYAHAIKGVAGNLGLEPIFSLSSQIAEPLRSGRHEGIKDKTDDMQKLEREYISIVNG